MRPATPSRAGRCGRPRRIGEVPASLAGFRNPGTIVLGGSVAGPHDDLLAGIRAALYRHALPPATRTVAIGPTVFGRWVAVGPTVFGRRAGVESTVFGRRVAVGPTLLGRLVGIEGACRPAVCHLLSPEGPVRVLA